MVLSKEQQGLIMIFLPKLSITLPNVLPRNPRDWTVLANWDLLSFISAYILLEKGFTISVFCLATKNNWWGSSLS